MALGICSGAAGSVAENEPKKGADIEPGDLRDYEPGTFYFERQRLRVNRVSRSSGTYTSAAYKAISIRDKPEPIEPEIKKSRACLRGSTLSPSGLRNYEGFLPVLF